LLLLLLFSSISFSFTLYNDDGMVMFKVW
jgi:hypothetical protein